MSFWTYLSNKVAAEAVVAETKAIGPKAIALRLEVGDIATMDAFCCTLKQSLKEKWYVETFDFVILNAGMGATVAIEKVTEELFESMLNVHFKGVYFLTQKSLAMLNDSGRIVTISSGTKRFGVFGFSVYVSKKSAVETFTR